EKLAKLERRLRIERRERGGSLVLALGLDVVALALVEAREAHMGLDRPGLSGHGLLERLLRPPQVALADVEQSEGQMELHRVREIDSEFLEAADGRVHALRRARRAGQQDQPVQARGVLLQDERR